jgi:hypothetical protein
VNQDQAQAIIDAVNAGWPADPIRSTVESAWKIQLAPLDFETVADYVQSRADLNAYVPTIREICNHVAERETRSTSVREVLDKARRDVAAWQATRAHQTATQAADAFTDAL